MASYQPTVLIIDDQPGIRQMFTMVLSDSGYNVLAAKNGYEGLQLASDNNPDAILLDFKMPVMDGMEVLKELTRQSQNHKVIMMTGCGDEGAILAAGARSYLAKPLDLHQLLKIIEEIVCPLQKSS